MCGIVAIFRPAGGLREPDLEAPLASIIHRGPDGSGSYCSPSGRAVLGHTRLAMIDLRDGGQPIATNGGDLQVVVSGEFYGHRDIAAELRRRGRVFRTRSDSEIAVHLYALQAEAALQRLRGEFALVVWDERRGELFAARDRFGIKPLYFAESGGRLVLASEIKALLAAGIPARWDLASTADHLQFALPADRTLFEGIRQVPAGCFLRADASGVRIERYWDLDYPPMDAGPSLVAPGERIEAIRATLTDAVLLRAEADVPVAYHLSGGLDSSSVVTIAARAGRRPATFTVRFDDAGFDEGPIAGRTADQLGTDHHEIPVHNADIAGGLAATIRAGEMLPENGHGVARYLQSAAIRRSGFTAVQAAEGGDELFLGYPQTRRDLALSRSGPDRARALAGYAQFGPDVLTPTLHTLMGSLGLIPSWVLERQMNVARPIRALLRDDFAELLRRRDSAASTVSCAASQLAGRSFVHQSQYLFIHTWMSNYILAAERLDMAHGLEVRLPMLDHELFEVVRDSPLDHYDHGGQAKYLLRAALAGELTREVEARPKHPFFAPDVTADDAAFSALRTLAEGPGLVNNPIVDPVKVRSALDDLARLPASRRARSERLVQIVAGISTLTESYSMTAGVSA